MLLYCHVSNKGVIVKNNIEILRKNKGFTLEYMSHSTGVTAGYICQLEKGKKTNPSLEIMKLIAKVLEEPINKVFFE